MGLKLIIFAYLGGNLGGLMKQMRFLFLVMILAACSTPVNSIPTPSVVVPTQSPRTVPTSTATFIPTPSPTPQPSSTATVVPTPTAVPDLIPVVPDSAVLYKQDFESASPKKGLDDASNWKVTKDESGNHILCTKVTEKDSWADEFLGYESWTNYAVEMRFKALEAQGVPMVSIISRYNRQNYLMYYAYLNFYNHALSLGYYQPYVDLGYANFPIPADPSAITNTWYTLRVEVAGKNIKYFMNNHLYIIANDDSSYKLSHGAAGFSARYGSNVCVDDIRVWKLTADGQVEQPTSPDSQVASFVRQTKVETVTDKAGATHNGGNNAWGGHQTRIVHTKDGIFTAYITDGTGEFRREWHLAERQPDSTWKVIAHGIAGGDPVNLLASPDGTLNIVGWPNGQATLWTGKPSNGAFTMTSSAIPNEFNDNYPYSSAGIDAGGNLCVLSSQGGQTPGGLFFVACYMPTKAKWVTQTTSLDFAFKYTYLFPTPDGQLSLVSTRDVRWKALGYEQPAGSFDYVFNALGVWQTSDMSKDPIRRISFLEEKPTEGYPDIQLDAQQDAYLDTKGQIHIIYVVKGESTRGENVSHHAIIARDGSFTYDEALSSDVGSFSRIFQDREERFYLLSSSGLIFPMGLDGIHQGSPIQLDLGGNQVEYSGFGLSVPRTGTPLSDVMDVVFPSANGTQWLYFQLDFTKK